MDIALAMSTAGFTQFSGNCEIRQATTSMACGTCQLGQDALPMQWACCRDHAVLAGVSSNCGSSP